MEGTSFLGFQKKEPVRSISWRGWVITTGGKVSP